MELVEGRPVTQAFLFDVSEIKNKLTCLLSHQCGKIVHEVEIDSLFEKATEVIFENETSYVDILAVFRRELNNVFGYNHFNVEEIVDIFFTDFARLLAQAMGNGIMPQYVKVFKIVGNNLIVEML